MLTAETISLFIRSRDLAGSIVCLHSSLKSFGPLENGAHTILDGFLAEGCTLVVPAFFYESVTAPPRGNYRRNGINYSTLPPEDLPGVSYTGSTDQIDRSMGIIPKTLLSYPAAYRTNNPLNSFCVCGPETENLIAGESLTDAYSIYKNIFASGKKARIVLAGVSFTSCTPIHYAEEFASRTLFRRWAMHEGRTEEVEVGSCSEGFEKLRGPMRRLETETFLGNAAMRIYPFREFISLAAEEIKKNPEITACSPDCERCRDMLAGGRIP